jgi:phosphoribosylformylglycinamidine synthase
MRGLFFLTLPRVDGMIRAKRPCAAGHAMSTLHAPNALVLRTAGTNCDGETVEALRLAGAAPERVALRALLDDPSLLEKAALVVVPGGFSYGDDVAAGRGFGLELRHGLARELARFAERGGLVVGICNGFQALLEAGLIDPGPHVLIQAGEAGFERSVALTDNASGRFECRWVSLRAERSACAWLAPSGAWPVPIAHAEGRLVARDPQTLARLESRGQVALRYCAPDGSAARAGDNPNGSAGDVAGLCDPSGRVLGLMPHPERNVHPWQHPRWTRLAPRAEGEGLAFWRALVEAAAGALLT